MVAQRGSPSSRHKGRSSRWSVDCRKQKTRRMTPMFCPLPSTRSVPDLKATRQPVMRPKRLPASAHCPASGWSAAIRPALPRSPRRFKAVGCLPRLENPKPPFAPQTSLSQQPRLPPPFLTRIGCSRALTSRPWGRIRRANRNCPRYFSPAHGYSVICRINQPASASFSMWHPAPS